MEIRCKVCRRAPHEIKEYVDIYREGDKYDSPEEACIYEEGTFNSETGKFYCTKCYISVGMPLGTA